MGGGGFSNLIQQFSVGVLQTMWWQEITSDTCSAGAAFACPWCRCPAANEKDEFVQQMANDVLRQIVGPASKAARTIMRNSVTWSQQDANQLVRAYYGKPALGAVTVLGHKSRLSGPRASWMPVRFHRGYIDLFCAAGRYYTTFLLELGQESFIAGSSDPLTGQRTSGVSTVPDDRIRRSGLVACDAMENVLSNIGPILIEELPFDTTGGEPMQVRTMVVGDPSHVLDTERGVWSPLMLRTEQYVADPQHWAHQAARYHDLSRFALAQAEFRSIWYRARPYSRGRNVLKPRGDSRNQMAEMNSYYWHWLARMHRFRVPVDRPLSASTKVQYLNTWVSQVLWSNCNEQCGNAGTQCTGEDCGLVRALPWMGNDALQ